MSGDIDILPPNFTFYGICMIVLGIIALIYTYRYAVPTGSIYLIFSGAFVLLMRRYGRIKN